VRAIQLAFLAQALPGGQADKHTVARRARFGRLAIYASAAYLVLMIRLPVWSAYLEVLNQSRWLREFVLQNDFQRIRSPRRVYPTTPEAQRMRDLELLYVSASQAWAAGRFIEAKDSYLRLAALVATIPQSSMTASGRQSAALALNNLGWLLATCPDVRLREPHDAVDFARRALDLVPNDGNTWNTLGVAYYRVGDWEEARSALYRSMELRNEGDGFDWFFLAMIHAKLGHKERAQEWYDRAESWTRRHRYRDAELYRFQVEAAQVLGLPRPPARPLETSPQPPSVPINPMTIPRRARSRVIDQMLPR
jgi:tetratricopeptide (TPR) repeat protein